MILKNNNATNAKKFNTASNTLISWYGSVKTASLGLLVTLILKIASIRSTKS